MRIFLKPDTNSRGINRVVDALIRYKPPQVEVVESAVEADLEIIHVYGRNESVERRIEKLIEQRKPFSMIQYALRSTMKPHTAQWVRMWEMAVCVWSYYDLYKMLDDDFVSGEFNFYHAPLGVEPDVFDATSSVLPEDKRFVVFATSQHALAEGVRECAFATKAVGRKMFFAGHELRRGPDIICRANLSDQEMAWNYAASEFVCGLRRVEGFELPVIEGAMCGARPIVFNQPHYKKWFNEFAIFIEERSRDQVIEDLIKIFTIGTKPISDHEKAIIRERFSWPKIISNYWRKLYE